MCYYCGECSDNCPKDADPASFVMASRRYAIEKYSWGKVASVFYNSSASMSIGLIAVTFFAIFGILLVKGSPTFSPPNLQTFVSFQVIHDVGMALGLIVGLSVVCELGNHGEIHARADRREVWAVNKTANLAVKPNCFGDKTIDGTD